MSAATSETPDQKRQRAYEREAAREQRKQQAIADRKLERLDLLDRFEGETNGVEGQEFAILDSGIAGEGFFVVTRGPSVLFKRYLDSKMTDADRFDFIAPNLKHPEIEKFKDAHERRPGLAIQLVNLLAGLYGIQVKADEGK